MKVTINFSKRWLYTFIAIGILAIIGVGVYAVAGVSHDLDELNLPSCSDGQILGMVGSDWACADVSSGVNLSGWSFENDLLKDDGQNVIHVYDSWLRLNPSNQFTSGIYTPGRLRADGGLYVSDDESFYRGAEDWIYTTDNLYSTGQIMGGTLKVSAGTILASSTGCDEAHWGEIRRCYYGTSIKSLCVCAYTWGWGWEYIHR